MSDFQIFTGSDRKKSELKHAIICDLLAHFFVLAYSWKKKKKAIKALIKHVISYDNKILAKFQIAVFSKRLLSNSSILSCVYTCKHCVCEPVCEHDVRVISTEFVNISIGSRTVRCELLLLVFQQVQRMFEVQ